MISDLEQIILRPLLQGDLYSLQIIRAIEEVTRYRRIQVNRLYPKLHKLEKTGYIASYWGKDQPVERNGARRKYYRLTETGREVLYLSESTALDFSEL